MLQLLLDDVALDTMDLAESRDMNAILNERDRAGSTYDLVIEGETYSGRLKRSLARVGRR